MSKKSNKTGPADHQPSLIPDDQISKKDALKDLEQEIIAESIKITLNQTTSCYGLVEKTKELIALKEARGI